MPLTSLLADYAAYAGFVLAWAVHFITARSYGKVSRMARTSTGIQAGTATDPPPVSVILTAHNQDGQLQRNLPQILEQDYENFEVIVINDASTDRTEEVLQQLEMKYPHLRHSTIPPGSRHISHKRLCLTVGFKAARHEWVLLIEPDSYPQSVYWISSMAGYFSPSVQMVLGYANCACRRNYLSRKVSFFNLFHQLQYLPWATRHKAYRCTPSNLAYRKSFFMAHKGFADDVQLVDGAAELLVNHHSTRENTAVNLSKEAKIICGNVESARQWKIKRCYYMETRRHFTHGWGYRFLFNLKQTIVPLFYCITLATASWSIWHQQWYETAAVALLTIALTCWKTFQINRSAQALDEKVGILYFLWFEMRMLWWHCCSWLAYRTSPRSRFYRKAF